MSASEGGDGPATNDEAINVQSSVLQAESGLEIMDQLDHAIVTSKDKTEEIKPSEKFKSESSTSGIDMGSKNPGSGDGTGLDMDSDDEDLHLEWEDDENDEKGASSVEDDGKRLSDKKGTREEYKDVSVAGNDGYKISDNKEELSIELTSEVGDDPDNSLDENLLLADDVDDDNQLDSKSDDEQDVNIDKLLDEDITEPNVDSNDTNINLNDKCVTSPIPADMDAKDKEIDKLDDKTIDHLDKDGSSEDIHIVSTSSPNASVTNITIGAKLDHSLNKLDAMLEIPTQEIIDILDDTDVSITCNDDNLDQKQTDLDITETVAKKTGEKASDVNTGDEAVVVKAQALDANAKMLDKDTSMNISVSEDDWSAIEKRLETFETSMAKDSEPNVKELKQSLEEKLNAQLTEVDDRNLSYEVEKVSSMAGGSTNVPETTINEESGDVQAKETNDEEINKENVPSVAVVEAATKSITTSSIMSTETSQEKQNSINIRPDDMDIDVQPVVPMDTVADIQDTTEQLNEEHTEIAETSTKVTSSDIGDTNIEIAGSESGKVPNELPEQKIIGTRCVDDNSSNVSLEKDIDINIESEVPEKKQVSDKSPSPSLDSAILKTYTEIKTSKSHSAQVSEVKSCTNALSEEKSDLKSSESSELALDDKIEPSDEKTILKPIDTDIPVSTEKDEVTPSTSESKPNTETPSQSTLTLPGQLASDSSDEAAEASDSLGLLAESSRVMEDDEDQEEDEEDDDDFYQEDESSNQMTAEHSEDSNHQHSETEAVKENEAKEIDNESPQEEKGQDEFSFEVQKGGNVEEKDGDMDVDNVVEEETAEKTEMVSAAAEEISSNVADGKNSGDADKVAQKQGIETVKISDTSDNEGEAVKAANETDGATTKNNVPENETTDKATAKPSSKKLQLSTPSNILSFVDLEESSSEDDIQVVNKDVPKQPSPDQGTSIDVGGSNVTLSGEIEVKAVKEGEDKNEGNASESKKESGVSVTVVTLPETKASEDKEKPKQKFGLEIFNLDSDDEETAPTPPAPLPLPPTPPPPPPRGRCVNPCCPSPPSAALRRAPPRLARLYHAAPRRRAAVCEPCARATADRTRTLVDGIRDLTPLLDMDPGSLSADLVEISDSESDEEADGDISPASPLGAKDVGFIEAELAKAINETWLKYKMDSRLSDAQTALEKEMARLEEETEEIDAMMNECQAATDQLRNDLYATFERGTTEKTALIIYDTPTNKYFCPETALPQEAAISASAETRAKRRLSSANEKPAKRPAIPMGYTPLDSGTGQSTGMNTSVDSSKLDDDKDIAVLQVSAETAPRDLPPPGELVRPPLRPDASVYVARKNFACWARARVLDVQGKSMEPDAKGFTIYRVRSQTKTKLVPGRSIAYADPPTVRLTIGTRVIALFKDPSDAPKRDTFYSGIVAEVPNPVNSYRYLVFFDDGYAQYVHHKDTRVVCECSSLVWWEVHPCSREFVRKYLIAYPERPMVRLHAGQSLKTEWNGKWLPSRVIQVDASLVQVRFEDDGRSEWIYRGSTRLAPLYLELQAAGRPRARLPRTKAIPRVNMPYVEYTRSDEQNKSEQPPPAAVSAQEREIRQRAVAKKSTAAPVQPQPPPAPTASEAVTSRVVYYTPKNAVKPLKMVWHNCGPHCRRNDTLALDDLRTYNPLAKPLLSGWERQIVRYNGHKEVMYRAPCGRRVRNVRELHRYLRLSRSDMAVDLFDFTPGTHCLAEFVLNKCYVGKKDLSHGKENVPVPCVNYYDDTLPEFCSYNTERTPTAGVPLNLDPEFLCGCDCTDDCEDKSKCACWRMTLEGARTIGLRDSDVGYVYRRLPEPLPSGIYECNSRCKCKQTCLNRVAQHPLQLKLQVFKTLNRGWGIRALNDVPKGSFLCVYAGNLLTDATANMDGLNEGDEYLAELDYIEVVEQMKEGYEEDVPEADKKLDRRTGKAKKNAAKPEESEESTSSSEEEEEPSKNEEDDDDFCPGFIDTGVAEFSKRLRKRDKIKKEKEEVEPKKEKEKSGEKPEEDCITISDDEEVREPSRFMAEAEMESNGFVSKYKSVRSYFGKDEACYIMDAKVQGNIGRYLNHSCMPNVFVQNVFVDTHDPRFPWVAFFALSHIRAGTELTWNYNYDVGSVPGKTLYCFCGSANCRGRLL